MASSGTSSSVAELPVDNNVELLLLLNDSMTTIGNYYKGDLANMVTSVGPYRKFDNCEFTASIGGEDAEYKGVGCSLFAFNLKSFAPIGYVPSVGAVKKRGGMYYNLPVKLKEAGGKLAKVQLKHQTTLCCPVLTDVAPLPLGQWLRLNGDLDTAAIVYQFAQLIESLTTDMDPETTTIVRDTLIPRMHRFVSHVPVDFKLFSPLPADARDMFAHAFQLTENVKIKPDKWSLLVGQCTASTSL